MLDDDSGGDLNSCVVFELPATGCYLLITTDFGNEIGSYELSVDLE